MRRVRVAAVCAAILLASCSPATTETTSSTAGSPAGSGNLAGCVENYTAGTDYFPHKATFDQATGITVTYHNSYKVVHEKEPLKGSAPATYVLVQCGTPTPELTGDLAGATVIEVPVKRAATSSTTQLPSFEMLDQIGSLVGVEVTDYVYSEPIKEAIAAGKIKGYGSASGEISVEQLVALKPDVLIAGGTANPAYDAAAKLGVAVIGNAEWLESSPLGRAEWLKLTALLTNSEQLAQQKFSEITKAYQETAAVAAKATKRPSVVTGAPYKGQWYRAGGQSYLAKFLADAGADYVFKDVPGTASDPVSLEVILASATGAEFWLNATTTKKWTSTQDITASDPRLSQIKALGARQVWNPTLRVGDQGGNDYWQLGVARPDLVLADMVAIFHPELMENHSFTFYTKLS